MLRLVPSTPMDPYAYFPGDPPVADILASLGLCVASIATLVALVLVAVVRLRTGPLTGKARRRAIGTLIGAALLGFVSAAPIAHRQFGAWGRLRAQLLELRSGFEQYRSAHPGIDDTALIDGFRAQNGEPWLFRFTREHRPVQITLTQTTPIPTFRVNFGRGGNADFDPDTMWVTYSD